MPLQRKLTQYTRPRNEYLPAEVYAEQGAAFLLTLRAYTGSPFFGNDALCASVVDLLAKGRLEYGCWVGVYCLMPDHLHLVSGPREDGRSVLTLVERFKGRTTNESWKHAWQGKLWQRRSHDHAIRRAESLEDIYTYVLANPVRAGLVEDAEDWPWSGIMDPIEW